MDTLHELQDFVPGKLVDLVTGVLKTSQTPPKCLDSLLRVAYYLSLHREEDRSLRFCMVLSQPNVKMPAEQCFLKPLPLDFELLRRLCVVADFRRMCIHVERSGKEQEFMVTGLAARPNLRRPTERLPIGPALIEVTGPARIGLWIAEAHVRFDVSEYYVVDGPSQILSNLSSPIPGTIVKRCTTPTPIGSALELGNSIVTCEEKALKENRDEVQAVAADAAPSVVVDTICGLLRLALEKGHGASFVFSYAPLDPRKSLNGVLQGGYWILERPGPGLPADPWNCGMLDYIGWLIHYELAQRGIAMLKDLPVDHAQLQDWARTICSTRMKYALQLWQEDLERCVQLSATDGLVIFDPLLRPRVFGAKIALDSFRALPQDCKDYLEVRGLRHRSTACAVSSLGAGLGFVVSQDGNITMFHQRTDRSSLTHVRLRF